MLISNEVDQISKKKSVKAGSFNLKPDIRTLDLFLTLYVKSKRVIYCG